MVYAFFWRTHERPMPKSRSIVFGSKASRLRWAILVVIVAFGFSADFLLKRDIGAKVNSAWLESCAQSLAMAQCEERLGTHHAGCFNLAYTSMIFTFGRERWESFRLIDYEACMNRDAQPDGGAPGAGPVVDI